MISSLSSWKKCSYHLLLKLTKFGLFNKLARNMKMIGRAKQSGRQDQPLKTTFSIHMKNSASSHKNTPGNRSRGDRQYGWTGNSWLNWNAKKKCIGWGDRNRLTRRRTEALPWHAEVELRGPKLAWRLTVEGHVEGSTKDFYKYVKNKRWTM